VEGENLRGVVAAGRQWWSARDLPKTEMTGQAVRAFTHKHLDETLRALAGERGKLAPADVLDLERSASPSDRK
jgi:hypothetical protein